MSVTVAPAPQGRTVHVMAPEPQQQTKEPQPEPELEPQQEHEQEPKQEPPQRSLNRSLNPNRARTPSYDGTAPTVAA